MQDVNRPPRSPSITLGQQLRMRDECEIDARRLQRQFDSGDMLAPFECCYIWREAGVPLSTLPAWVSERLFYVSAAYFESGPFPPVDVFAEPDPHGTTKVSDGITPADYKKMEARERDKVTPSLDAIAELRGGHGKRQNAWLRRAHHGADEYVDAFLTDLADFFTFVLAVVDPDNPDIKSAMPDIKIPILNSRGQLTEEIQAEAARIFRLRGDDLTEAPSRAKTTRRRRKRLHDTDS